MEDDIIICWDKAEINNALLENKNFEKFKLRNSDILLESIIRNEYDIFKRILNSTFKLNNNVIMYVIPIIKNYKNDYFKYLNDLNQNINIKNIIHENNPVLHTSIVNYAIEKKEKLLLSDLSKFGIDWNKKYKDDSILIKYLKLNIDLDENIVKDINKNNIDDEEKVLKILKKKSKKWINNNKIFLEMLKYDYK